MFKKAGTMMYRANKKCYWMLVALVFFITLSHFFEKGFVFTKGESIGLAVFWIMACAFFFSTWGMKLEVEENLIRKSFFGIHREVKFEDVESYTYKMLYFRGPIGKALIIRFRNKGKVKRLIVFEPYFGKEAIEHIKMNLE